MTAIGYTGVLGGITSVNGDTGPAVVLDAGDVGAVAKTGDTMSGDLLINADLGVTGLATVGTQVSTPLVTSSLVDTSDLDVDDDAAVGDDLAVGGTLTAQYAGTGIGPSDVMRLMATALSTGAVSGGDFTPNADPTKIDISAMTGWIVDYDVTSPISGTNPRITYVSMPAQIGVTPAFGNPLGVCWYQCDATGTLVMQATQPTATERRQRISLGATAQVGGVIVVDQTLPAIQSQPLQQLIDLIEGLGPFSISGNRISPNGVNLNLNKAAGTVFVRAFNQIPGYNDPHTSPLAAQTPASFRHITAVAGSAGALTSTLNVGNYDPAGAGVVTPVGGGANTSTNFRVWGFANNSVNDQMLVQYGQSTYTSLANAVAAIGTTNFIRNPAATAAGVLLGWVSVIRTAVDLSNPAQATFTSSQSKFPQP